MLCQSYSEHPAAKAGCIDDAWLSGFCPGALGLAAAACEHEARQEKIAVLIVSGSVPYLSLVGGGTCLFVLGCMSPSETPGSSLHQR